MQQHIATDRRCYNGAMSSDLQREMDQLSATTKMVVNLCPGFRCVYFPMEGKWLAFVVNRQLTGNMHSTKWDCLNEAWRFLVGN